MSEYQPNGKAHRTMEQLAESSASDGELRRALLRTDHAGGPARKLWYITNAMRRDGLLERRGCCWSLTEAGWQALNTLRAGYPVIVLTQETDEATP